MGRERNLDLAGDKEKGVKVELNFHRTQVIYHVRLPYEIFNLKAFDTLDLVSFEKLKPSQNFFPH